MSILRNTIMNQVYKDVILKSLVMFTIVLLYILISIANDLHIHVYIMLLVAIIIIKA